MISNDHDHHTYHTRGPPPFPPPQGHTCHCNNKYEANCRMRISTVQIQCVRCRREPSLRNPLFVGLISINWCHPSPGDHRYRSIQIVIINCSWSSDHHRQRHHHHHVSTPSWGRVLTTHYDTALFAPKKECSSSGEPIKYNLDTYVDLLKNTQRR